MKFNFEFVFGVAYVFCWVGVGIALIGQSSGPPTLFTFTAPIKIGLMVAFPFLLGYLAGTKS